MINGNVSHWWQQVGAPSPRPALQGDLQVDVAIVGAGYTGLWTAYYPVSYTHLDVYKRQLPRLAGGKPDIASIERWIAELRQTFRQTRQ